MHVQYDKLSSMFEKITMLKVWIILGVFVGLLYVFITLESDREKLLQNQFPFGSFCMKDSPQVILNLLPGHMFRLEKGFDKYYGDGNWQTQVDGIIRVTLEFEIGKP